MKLEFQFLALQPCEVTLTHQRNTEEYQDEKRWYKWQNMKQVTNDTWQVSVGMDHNGSVD